MLDVIRQLPIELWFHEHVVAFDTNFIPQILALLPPQTLLILDRGFYDFPFFANLIEKGGHFIIVAGVLKMLSIRPSVY